uniref:Uncharacterized protein n=1 Tax=Anguilla anguilla TaxID=7936 RepID=A0A0E9P7N2_ANGAN
MGVLHLIYIVVFLCRHKVGQPLTWFSLILL